MSAPGAYLASRRADIATHQTGRPSYWRTWRGRRRTTSLAGDAVHRDRCPVIPREHACSPWRQLDGQPPAAVRALVAIDPLLDLCAVCFGTAPATPGARMPSQELDIIRPGQSGAPPATLDQRLAYAQAMAEAGMLPRQYQKQPGNLLLAQEVAVMFSVSTMAAIMGVPAVEGQPRPSADFTAAVVRRAGHRLRVRIEGDGAVLKAVAEITRKDDPEYTYRSEWDVDRATQAGLMGKDVWKKHTRAMLKHRAVTEVARDACSEVLLGIDVAGADPALSPFDEDDVADAEIVDPQTSAPVEAAGDGQEVGRDSEGKRTPADLQTLIKQHAVRLFPGQPWEDQYAEVEGEFAQMFNGTALRNATPAELDAFETDLGNRVPVVTQ